MDYELVIGSPNSSNAEFREASPFGKIPAIRDGDFTLSNSTAIVVYLEARQPAPALLPADPQARGRAIWFDEFADTIFGASALKILFNRLVAPRLLNLPYDEEIAKQGEAELPRSLDYLESVAPAEGWLAGDFSLGDISVASMIKTLSYVGLGANAAQYPRTAAWYERVAARPGWQAVAAIEAKQAERMNLVSA